MRLAVRLTPGADADRLDGWSRDEAGRPVLNVRVRAAPSEGEGEADAALEALLAKALFRPKSAVRVVKGGSAPIKLVEIDGVEDDALQILGGGPR